MKRIGKQSRIVAVACAALMLAAAPGRAQLATSAYRVLGQPGMRANGANLIQGLELSTPVSIAVDARGGQVHLYVADGDNSRVLAWQDVQSYQNGDPPAIVLAQPSPQSTGPMGIGVKGLYQPVSLAVDPLTGNLFVADVGNNRVVRFPNPFANPSRVEPDAVYGQASFNVRVVAAGKAGMNQPRGVAVDSSGNLWVADTGNHRVLRISASALDSPAPVEADTVIGQKDFTQNNANRGSDPSAGSFDTPVAMAFDSKGNLFVADFNNARVVKYAGPPAAGANDVRAVAVIGQPDFVTRAMPQASASTMAGPNGLAFDSSDNLYVAVPRDNRVLTFPAGSSGNAKSVLGQSDFVSTTANASVNPRASANTLAQPVDVRIDAKGNVYVADSGNNRVLCFPSGAKAATTVWGQVDFVANGPNQVKPVSLSAPYKVAVDYTSAPFALYVSDVVNNRVLFWKDGAHFRSGDPADGVIGQPDLRTAIANVDSRNGATPSATSLFAPGGIAVDQKTGALYVADTGNHRVLRYARPVAQSGRIAAEAVIGQSDFTSATSAAVNAGSLRSPTSVAIGPDGDLFVADTGNNRVLEYATGAGNQARALRVYGQPNPNSAAGASLVSAQTLTRPRGVFVDAAFNLYVADTGAHRVLIYPNTQFAPAAGMAASFVVGQGAFDSSDPGYNAGLNVPIDVTADTDGNLYVADGGNNRVVQFSSLVFLPVTGATPTGVIGQPNVSGRGANWDSPDSMATPEGLSGPVGVFLDRQGTLYVSDGGNHRLLHFLKQAVLANSATLQASVPVAPGALVKLFGSGMADSSASATGTPWPSELVGRQVVVNDEIRASLSSVAPDQVAVQIPGRAPSGSNRIAVRTSDTGELIAGGNLLVAATAPGLFTAPDSKGQGQISNQDGSLNSSSNPAAKGSVVTLYGTGQGQVSPQVPDGVAAPASPPASTVAVPTSDGKVCVSTQPSMCVAVGSSFGDVQFSGLAPGSVGLWQINVKLPADAPSGNVPVRVVINGTPSNTVTVAVR